METYQSKELREGFNEEIILAAFNNILNFTNHLKDNEKQNKNSCFSRNRHFLPDVNLSDLQVNIWIKY